MSIYNFALFLHVSGAIGYFVSIGIWLFGIVFLMTTKPSLPGSLIVIAVALALGLASGLLISRPARTRVQGVDAGGSAQKSR